MKSLLITLSVMLLIVAAISSCKKDEGAANDTFYSRVTCNESDDTLNTYNGKIKTILNTNCAISSCHAGSNIKAGKNYSTYTQAVNSFSNTLCSVYREGGCDPMPDGAAKLSDADIHDLTCWAKNNFPE